MKQMRTSAAMDEIRRIRNANSIKHLSQSPDERKQELQKSMDWFAASLGKPIHRIREERGAQ
jgi:hypothetical protein